MFLYLKTTLDNLELPIAVADSAVELAEMIGTNANVVYSSISKGRKGWYKVEVENEERTE